MSGHIEGFRTASSGAEAASFGSVALSWIVVFLFGTIEGLFGRTQYLGDWISYLNVSRAVSILDWREIFDPMWNPGYPFLIALARGIAPPTPEGEWYAITGLNILIFLGVYAAWRHLIRTAITFYRPASTGLMNDPVLVCVTTSLFLACCLGLQKVSSVSPDLLVTGGFLLAAAQTLRVINRRTVVEAAMLGIVLGVGVWVKGIFTAFAFIFLLMIVIDCLLRRSGWRLLLTSAAFFTSLFACYVGAISWSYGGLTLGATGALNYAFHVNHLPHWTNWQGGPPPFGTPVHPTRQLLPGMPAFEFATPFQSTYPPYNNMAYWYQGFHQFHSLGAQISAVYRSIILFAKIVYHHTILIGVAIALIVSLLKREWRQAIWNSAAAGWPLFLPALMGIATYLTVHVEDRYLGPFVLVFGLLPLASLLKPELPRRNVLAAAMAAIMVVAALGEIARDRALGAAIRGADFHDDAQWKLAEALSAHGLRKGDAVAVIRGTDPPYWVHWAYISGIRIVSEFGAEPWILDPDVRIRSDGSALDPGDVDYGRVFWVDLTPVQRAAVLDAFRATGARAVVSLSNPEVPPGPGWVELNGTKNWIYDFNG